MYLDQLLCGSLTVQQDFLVSALPPLPLESLSLHVKLDNFLAGLYFPERFSDADSGDDTTVIHPTTPPPCATEVYMSTLSADAVGRPSRFLQALERLQSVEVNVEFWINSIYNDQHIRLTRLDIRASVSNCASF